MPPGNSWRGRRAGGPGHLTTHLRQNMNAPTSSMDQSHRRGRVYLIAALVLIAAFILNGFLQSVSKGEAHLASGIIGNGLSILALILAFRGGQISMKLAKGCALLWIGMVALLAILVSVTVLRGTPLPAAPTLENTIPVLAMVAASAFCVWALFISKDVKSFVAFQRERAYQSQLDKIKRK